MASFASLRLYLRYIAILASIGLATIGCTTPPVAPEKGRPCLACTPTRADRGGYAGDRLKGGQIRSQSAMDSDNLSDLKLKRIEESARGCTAGYGARRC